MIRVVVDTNVIYSGLNSRLGASFLFLQQFPNRKFKICISTPLVFEYEDAIKRRIPHLSLSDKDDFLDYLCSVGEKTQIFYLWRPTLKDPSDDMVLEVAVSSNSEYIVTFNKNDFEGAKKFGIQMLTPKEFLHKIGVLK